MPGAFPRTIQLTERGIAAGLHIGAQACIVYKGEVILDYATGLARPSDPDLAQSALPMTPDTIILWMSAGKPITAIAIAQLWEQGKLNLDDPVSLHIPEFAQQQKEAISIRHVLTHMAPLRMVDLRWPAETWEQTIARICAARPEPRFIAGRSAGYSLHATWFILGEIVRRLSGQQIEHYLRDHIFRPAGMTDTFAAMNQAEQARYADRLDIMQVTEKHPAPLFPRGYDTPEAIENPRPSASIRGPMRDLARFYESLARGLQGQEPATESLNRANNISPAPDPFRPTNPAPMTPHPTPHHAKPGLRAQHSPLLLPQTLEAMTARHRAGTLDKTFNAIIDWGLGFIINSSIYGNDATPYQYGPHASPRTFGHSGNQSSAGFHDPENSLTIALCFNGMPGEARHQVRMREVLASIYEELNIV